MIAKDALDWPGFRRIYAADAFSVFENDLALPLGVVYERQLPRERFATLSTYAKDIAMMNAVVVERLRGDAPRVFDEQQLARASADWLTDHYFTPARQLQHRGMAVERFSHGRITGTVASDVPGVLVFSIPYAQGWSVAVDAVEQPVFKANLGMLAVDISRGRHEVELSFSLPGLIPGAFFGLLGILALGMLERRAARLNPAQAKPDGQA
jgi:uncharacterized membrane protein YfhO